MHSTSITAMAILLSGASAHLFMKSPVPFGHDANGDPIHAAPYGFPPNGRELQPSPLGKDPNSGIVQNFPCQFGPDFKYPMNDAPKVAAGSSTLLTFQGSAVHGGGSCQVSLAKSPSADPKDWHVIHSIVGGCPGITAPGQGEHGAGTAGGMDNFINKTPNKPNAPICTGVDTDEIQCLKKYNVPIPKEVASGKYFFAWTWFNKLGNREMYMNCAPLEVTDGASSDEWLNKQPGIFYANYADKPCVTGAGFSLNFTQPGDSVLRSQNPFDNVEVGSEGTGPTCAALYPPQSSKPAHEAFLQPAAGGSGTAPASSIGSLPASSAGSFPTATSFVGTTSMTASASSTDVPVSAASTSSAYKPGASAPAASSVSAAPTVPAAACAHPCIEEGKFLCLASNQFGICDHGCVVAQAVAVGTHCLNGAVAPGPAAKRNIKDTNRVMKPRRAPLRKSAWKA